MLDFWRWADSRMEDIDQLKDVFALCILSGLLRQDIGAVLLKDLRRRAGQQGGRKADGQIPGHGGVAVKQIQAVIPQGAGAGVAQNIQQPVGEFHPKEKRDSVKFLEPSNADWAIELVTSGLRQRLEKFLGSEKVPTYEESKDLTAWCWAYDSPASGSNIPRPAPAAGHCSASLCALCPAGAW